MIKATKWFMLVATVLIIAYDIVVATNSGKGDTISEISLKWAWDWPILALSWGVVVGHLFWPVPVIRHKWPKIYALWGIGAVGLGVDIFWLTGVFPLIPLVVGIVLGHLLWPQKRMR